MSPTSMLVCCVSLLIYIFLEAYKRPMKLFLPILKWIGTSKFFTFRPDGEIHSQFSNSPKDKSKCLSTAKYGSFLALFPAFIRSFQALNTALKGVFHAYNT